MEHLEFWPILYWVLGGAGWGFVALLCARKFTHGENRIAAQQVGLRPMLVGAVLMLWGTLTQYQFAFLVLGPGYNYIITQRMPTFAGSPEANYLSQMISPAELGLVAVVHIAAMVYMQFLDTERNWIIFTFPMVAPINALGRAIGEKDNRFKNVGKIAATDPNPCYMKRQKRSNIITVASIVVTVGLWIILFVFVSR